MGDKSSSDDLLLSDSLCSQRTGLLNLLDSRRSFLIRQIDFRRVLTLELREVGEDEYYLGEQAHHSVGVDAASAHFAANHGQRFRNAYEQNKTAIDAYCDRVCGPYECRGNGQCSLSNQDIHQLLQD